MTGRARGRARGRGRGQEGGQQQQQARPGGGHHGGQAGRGRARGAQPQHQHQHQHQPPQHQHQPPQHQHQPPQHQHQQQQTQRVPQSSGSDAAGGAACGAAGGAAIPTAQMQNLSVQDRQDAQPNRAQQERPQDRTQQRRRGLGEENVSTLVTRSDGVVKQGKTGVPVKLMSNFFKVLRLPVFQGLFQYNVTFDPDIQSNRLKSALLHELAEVIGTARCFDGMTLFLPIKLPERDTIRNVTTRQGNDIQVKIMFTNEIPDNSPSIVQLMNILFRKQLRVMNMQLVGRNYYHPDRKIEIRAHKMEVWPGYSTSILQYEKDVMLCADVAHKVLSSQTVLDFLYGLYNSCDRNRFYDIASKKLLGEIILTRYNNKTYRIDDIDWTKHPTDKFTKVDGSQITFKEYYETVYERKVMDDKQPLLISRPKEKDRRRGMAGPILLLPEFCVITGLSEELRQNFTVMKDLAQHTRIAPSGRVQNLRQFMTDLYNNPEATQQLGQWNMQFDKDLLKMDGRVLPPEVMFQKGDKFNYKQQDADWSKETRGRPLIQCVNMHNWVLLCTERDANIANDFVQTLIRVCGPMGMHVDQPLIGKIRDDSARAYFEALKDLITPQTMMVVCIVPNNRKDRYDTIKKMCCVERPIPSQVIVSRTLSKKQMLMSVCTKIGIQLNCKLGGEVWAVDIPMKGIMVVGFDVYHDSLTKGKSIGGFVASTNKFLTRYYSRITMQTSHQEIADQLKVCMSNALKKYHEVNHGELPLHIIVYRDGVGDGQIKQVHDHEVPQLEAALKDMYKDHGNLPKFALIIVKKRVSTRLFLTEGSNIANPSPGTVVDSVVTRPEWMDFFLISQSVRQGTVTPTHYNIIKNSTNMQPDHFQRLTYKLCHLYYNWPGTIRVPAPCQYAHKLAFLVGQSVHTEPDELLADRLYYL